MKIIDTTSALLIKYQTPTPRLDIVREDYFPHVTVQQLARKAAAQELPFPVFKIDQSRKAPYFVHISALAGWIDAQHKEAQKDFTNLHL